MRERFEGKEERRKRKGEGRRKKREKVEEKEGRRMEKRKGEEEEEEEEEKEGRSSRSKYGERKWEKGMIECIERKLKRGWGEDREERVVHEERTVQPPNNDVMGLKHFIHN